MSIVLFDDFPIDAFVGEEFVLLHAAADAHQGAFRRIFDQDGLSTAPAALRQDCAGFIAGHEGAPLSVIHQDERSSTWFRTESLGQLLNVGGAKK